MGVDSERAPVPVTDCCIGWRDICRSTDSRTVIASVIPKAAVGHTFPLMMTSASPSCLAALYANLCSFVLDYAARQKIGGTHLTYSYLKQLPVLAPDRFGVSAPWLYVSWEEWIGVRVLELAYTA